MSGKQRFGPNTRTQKSSGSKLQVKIRDNSERMQAFFIVLLTVLCTHADGRQCERKWKKVGCFHDNVTTRPLMYELINRLDFNSSNFDGKMIDWDNYPKALHELYCKCAELTKQRGYTHFGLQFYAECWSGPNATERYGMQGTSDNCIGADYKPCVDSADTECIGKDRANYVYQITREAICKKAIDFGIVFDASRSIKPKNYDKIKSFVKDLTYSFTTGPSNTRFCIIHYSESIRFDLAPRNRTRAAMFRKGTAIQTRIDSIMYSYGGTRADTALRLAETEFFCSGCNPIGKPKVLIVITTGNTGHGSEDLGQATQGMKDNKVKIVSIGIGSDVNASELKLIASEPKDQHVFQLANFDELKTKLDRILMQACAATS